MSLSLKSILNILKPAFSPSLAKHFVYFESSIVVGQWQYTQTLMMRKKVTISKHTMAKKKSKLMSFIIYEIKRNNVEVLFENSQIIEIGLTEQGKTILSFVDL